VPASDWLGPTHRAPATGAPDVAAAPDVTGALVVTGALDVAAAPEVTACTVVTSVHSRNKLSA